MTCIKIPNGIVCGFHPGKRFHVGNKYIWMEFHPYCGPGFWKDHKCSIEYEPSDNDPIWPMFDKWLEKYNAKIQS